MRCFLAGIPYGEKSDLSGADWLLVLVDGAILLVVCGLIVIPTLLSMRRGHPRADAIRSGAILWGLIAAWSAISLAGAEFKWSRERLLLIQSGYFDPQNASAAPSLPWALWAVLTAGYGFLIFFSISVKNPAPLAPASESSGGNPARVH